MRPTRRLAGRFRSSLSILALLLSLSGGTVSLAHAQADSDTLPAIAPSASTSPVVLTADEVIYDEVLGLVIARGRVEISQDDRLVRADQVTYDQRDGVVTASGNVVLVDDSGNLLFADYAELDDTLADGFIHRIGLLLADDSRMAAAGGTRRGDGITELIRAVYSPCDLCPDNPDRPPLWQLRARHVEHDSEAKDIVYRDAFFDLAGVPILYTPYFSHPDPTVRQRSGFLPPDFGTATDIGLFANGYYYWAIAPDRDATLRAGITSRRGPIIGGEYRQRFNNGTLQLAGSVNHSRRVDATEAKWRGHLFGNARFDLNEVWRTGADVNVASDNRYLRTFLISSASTLRNRVFVEGFPDAFSYARAEAYGFQSVATVREPMPAILPWLQFQRVSEPGAILGGQGRLNMSGLVLLRPRSQVWPPGSGQAGRDVVRTSIEPGWQRTFHSDAGLVTTLNLAVRADGYAEDNRRGGGNWNWSGRIYPYGSATVRYPLVRQSGRWQQLIEPIAALSFAESRTTGRMPPNNDSIDLELDEISLFSPNRFLGLDRVETGTRMTYGMRFGLFDDRGGSYTAFFGQSHRFATTSQFPTGSGLENRWSDLVGRITIRPNQHLDLDYRFRINNERLADRRQELTLSTNYDRFTLSGTYTKINAVAGTGTDQNREELTSSLGIRLSDYWRASGSLQYDIAQREPRGMGFGLLYEDECTTLSVEFRRSYTRERGSSRETRNDSVFMTVSFRNLGSTPLPLWSRSQEYTRAF